MGFLARSVFLNEIHICRITVFIRTRCNTFACVLEIESISPTPFPRVIEIEHCHHIALSHLHQEIVKTGKNCIVIHSRCFLKCWFHFGLYTSLAVRAYKYSKIVYAHLLHIVKFTAQTLAVASRSLRTEDGSIPEVCADIIIRFTVLNEMSVNDLHEIRLCIYSQTKHSHNQKQKVSSHCF